MIKPLSGAFALALALVSGTAVAGSCPVQVRAIDAALAGMPDMSSAMHAKVKALRDDGEQLHKSGRHGDSMAKLLEAKSMLGIQ